MTTATIGALIGVPLGVLALAGLIWLSREKPKKTARPENDCFFRVHGKPTPDDLREGM